MNTTGQSTKGLDLPVVIRQLIPAASLSLKPFVDSTNLASGQINLISLEAVAERMGARWEARRDSIYQYVERTLERRIDDKGFFLRVSETDFLVVLPNEGKFSAQARCLRYLSELLTHFLGDALPADMRVRQVVGLSDGCLQAVQVDANSVQVGAERERIEAAQPVPRAVEIVDQWTPFVASNDRALRVSCVLDPVFELKNYARIGYRISRRVLDIATETGLTRLELQDLSRNDIEKIDLATVARGIGRLRAEADGERQLSLIIPVSYISLSHTQGRASLAALFKQAKALVKAGIICEVCDIENVPHAALLAATSLIKPFCILLIGHSTGPPQALGQLSNTGLQALSFDAPQGIADEHEFQDWAKGIIVAAKRAVNSVMIYQLTPRQAGMAALLGASHASLRMDD